MAGFAFARKQDIDAVLRMIGVSTTQATSVTKYKRASENVLAMTPAGGIPATNGLEPGVALCVPYYISLTDKLMHELKDTNGNTKQIEIFNPFSSPVGGSRIVTAKYVFGALIVDAEDCQ